MSQIQNNLIEAAKSLDRIRSLYLQKRLPGGTLRLNIAETTRLAREIEFLHRALVNAAISVPSLDTETLQ